MLKHGYVYLRDWNLERRYIALASSNIALQIALRGWNLQESFAVTHLPGTLEPTTSTVTRTYLITIENELFINQPRRNQHDCQSHTHARIHSRTHAYTHARIHTRTHTHTINTAQFWAKIVEESTYRTTYHSPQAAPQFVL